MVKVYAVALIVGLSALIAWIFATYVGNERPQMDPDRRFGRSGRRLVAGLVAFGIAGLSAEFSPRDLTWPVALLLALLGAVAAAWYVGWIDRPQPSEKQPAEP
ncbi:MAG: hypothetical protein ACR2ME_07255 [Acidimicrobiia bacterium]